MVFHNGSSDDYQFIINQLAEEFEGQFKCPGENTEKYITLMPIEKQENWKTTEYKIRFIGSIRFMASSLSRQIDNLAEGLYKGKCKILSQILKHESQKWFTYIEVFELQHKLWEKVWKGFIQEIWKYISALRWRHWQVLSHVAEKCFSIGVHGWLGKIHWNTIIHKEEILQQSGNEQHHRLWLQTC